MGRIVIVGGGIIGTALAYFLRDSKDDVVLLEKTRLAAGSTGESRFIFAWHLNTEGVYYDICERSWEHFQPLIQNGYLNFHNGGFLKLALTDAYLDDLEALLDPYDRVGTNPRLLDATDLAEYKLDPTGASPGGLYLEEGRFTDDAGRKMTVYFADRAAAGGVDIRTRVHATDVTTTDGTVTGVDTTAGHIDADVVVNAAGPWSTYLNEKAGVRLELKHTLAPMIEFRTREEFGPNGPLSLITYEDGLYFVGGFPRRVWAGNAPHESGDADVYDQATQLDAETAFDSPLANDFRRAVAERVDTTHPVLVDSTIVDEYKCIRTITPDHYPLVGETELDGYYAATGMNGQGITIGPAVSESLANHILTGKEDDAIAALHPHRF